MAIKITLTQAETFLAHAAFSDREVLKKAGFLWYPEHKHWATDSPQVAARLRVHCDSNAKTKIDRSLIRVAPWSGRIPCPKGLWPKKFQTLAAHYALSRNRSYLALDPGLGKTIIEALIINALDPLTPIIVINPPGLCLNTERELLKWCPDRVRGESGEFWLNKIWIYPDSMIADPLGKHQGLIDQMTALGDAVLFVDEAQRFSNPESKRTQALFRIAERFEKIIFMSGTPMRKRPIELWPILSRFAGETIGFMSHGQYGFSYCAAYFDDFGHLNTEGHCNTPALFDRIKEKFMLRIKKENVLPELPPKTREIVFLDEGTTPIKVTAYEREHLKKLSPKDCLRFKITQSPALATYRRLLGRFKLKASLSFIRDILDGGDEYLLVLAEHREVIEGLEKGLAEWKPIVITGKQSKEEKQNRVNAFQAKQSRLVIANTLVMVGYTLTQATRVIEVEAPWVPADSDQATDRAHRIGQKHPVFVQTLVFKNSLDARILNSQMAAREVADEL